MLEPIFDALVWAVSLAVADVLRYDNVRDLRETRLLVVVALAVSGQLVIGYAGGLYRVKWRVGSFENMAILAQTFAIVTVGLAVVNLVVFHHAIPASATVAGGAFALFLAGAVRWAWRVNWERTLRPLGVAERALVFGAGEAGAQLISALMTDPASRYLPVALLDDDPGKRHSAIRHLRVRGDRTAMAHVARREQATVLIIAIPSAESDLIRELSQLAQEAALIVKVLPPVAQLLESSISAADIRSLTEEDLLGRRVVDTEVATVAGYVTGRRVLVTGAGGSIGSELCRQLVRYEPERLVMLDRDESGLHQVQLSIEGRAMLDDRSLVVCDIRDQDALRAAFAEHRPEVVFHAAALKHLPLLEMWPAEAVKTNIYGTHNVLRAATSVGVSHFVNISTDKAANPCSVLGYTKRIAERLTASVGLEVESIYLSVRFGNVLGSRGSVLTTFHSQIAAGGPVTVTSPEVSRYFMTVEEAVQLVIQAGAVGRTGEVLVLDMGQPVRIAEVAERMVEESGEDIPIVYTGLRPGEKLREELFGTDEVDRRPRHPLISQVMVPAIAWTELQGLLVSADPHGLKRELGLRSQAAQTDGRAAAGR